MLQEKLTIFKLEPTTPNMSQHVVKGWQNARNMLRPTILRYISLTCCDRLLPVTYLLHTMWHIRPRRNPANHLFQPLPFVPHSSTSTPLFPFLSPPSSSMLLLVFPVFAAPLGPRLMQFCSHCLVPSFGWGLIITRRKPLKVDLVDFSVRAWKTCNRHEACAKLFTESSNIANRLSKF